MTPAQKEIIAQKLAEARALIAQYITDHEITNTTP